MMKKLMKRTLAVVLALTMCVSMLSLNAFAAATGDTCPTCGKGTIVTDKGNPNHLICDYCGEFSEYIQDTKPTCAHEKTYLKDNGNGTHSWVCTACETPVSTEKHDFGDDGKCECGAQEPVHEHSWTYTPVYWSEFTHVKTCSTCGETVTEACTTQVRWDPWTAQYVKECTLCNYWSMPVSDVHNWAEKWEPDGNGHHTLACTDAGCDATRTEECKLVATDDGAGVYCTVCGWVKYNDGTPGGDESKYCKGEHVFGNVYQHNDGYHWQQCMNCPYTTDHVVCDWSLEYKDNSNIVLAQVCSVCGNTKLMNYEDVEVCPEDPTHGHNWLVDRTELATDGKTKLTIVKCTKCGMEKVDGKCNSEKDEYTLTINYVYDDNGGVFHTYTGQFVAGKEYSVTSQPAPNGYEFAAKGLDEVKSGIMPENDLTLTVSYKPITYTWTIKYVDEQDNELSSKTVIPYTILTVKDLSAPANPNVPGYTVKEVSVTNPDPQQLGDVYGKVVYEPIEYTWTINYVDENGNPMEGMEPVIKTFDVTTIKSLESVTSPSVTGYSATPTVVEAPSVLDNVTNYVVYKLSTDFQLTVIHRYVALNGAVTEETQASGKAYKIGDAYTTTAQGKTGYTLSATPANANGFFVAEDVTVVYVYNAVTPPTPVVPNPPVVTDPPVVEVEDPDVPLVEQPDVPDEVEIEEPDVPLTELPDEIEIDEPDVPLAEMPEEIELEDDDVPLADGPEEVELEDSDVPLADVPKTGDNSYIWGVLTLVSGVGLVWLALDKKRKGAEE